jgi:hypothetical protein
MIFNFVKGFKYKWNNETRNIRKQITVAIIMVIVGTLLLIFLLNKLLLSRVYMYNKTRVMQDAFSDLDKASKNGEVYTDDYYDKIEETSA